MKLIARFLPSPLDPNPVAEEIAGIAATASGMLELNRSNAPALYIAPGQLVQVDPVDSQAAPRPGLHAIRAALEGLALEAEDDLRASPLGSAEAWRHAQRMHLARRALAALAE